MEQYLIDTNVVSDYLSDSFSPAAIVFVDAAIDATPKLSVITQIELLCWKTDKITEQNVRNFISDSVIPSINPDVIEQCVKIRRHTKIKTPDAIIAATAVAYRYTIVTNNEKDFAHIQGLKIINPHRL